MMAEQPAKPPIRFVAEFSQECHVTTLLRRVWILLPNHLGTVSELAAYLGDNFIQLDPEAPVNIVLEIGGVPVAPYEDIAIIRDSDTIRVRVYQPEAEFPALEGPQAKLAIEGAKEVKAGGVNKKKKKLEEDSLVKGDKKKKRKKEEGETEVVAAKVSEEERKQVDSKTPEGEGKRKKRLKKGRSVELPEELGERGLSVETGAPSIEKKGKKVEQTSRKEQVLEEEEGRQLERVGRTEGDKKRKKRSRDEVAGVAEEGVRAGAQELVQPLEKARKRKRVKGNEDEVAQEVREPEAPLQLEWVEEAAGGAAGKLPESLQRESSSESESEDEAPKEGKRTPSRSARRKAAKRRYARLAREAAAAGGSEAVVLYPGDKKASGARATAPPIEEAREQVEIRNAVPASNGPLSRQHMHFGDSDEEEGAQKTRAARQPPIVLNVGLGPSGQPLSKERGKEWGLQKGRKKDRFKGEPREQTPSWAAVPPPEQIAPKALGEGRKVLGEAKRRRTADEYERLPDLNRPPQIADVLAYRLVELTSSWTPQISEYREGRVTAFDAASGMISLAWWPAEDLPSRKEAFAQLDGEETEEAPPAFAPPYDEDGNLESDLSSLMGVKLVQASDVTLAQLPGAPPVPTTGLTFPAGKETPASVLVSDGAGTDGLQAKNRETARKREQSNVEGAEGREKEGDSTRPDGLSGVNGSMKEGAWSHDRVEVGGVSNENGHGDGGLAEPRGQQESEKATVLQDFVGRQLQGLGAPPADVSTASALAGESVAGDLAGGPTDGVKSMEERAAEEARDVPGRETQHANGALEEVMEAANRKNPLEIAGKSGVEFKAGKSIAGRGAVENGRPEVAAGLKGLNATKGAAPMPPAWQAWESVAQLLARRRAEIAEAARKQEEERKKQREAEEKAAEQREEGSEGEGERERNGEKRDEQHLEGFGGAPEGKEEGKDECGKEQHGQRTEKERGPERELERTGAKGSNDVLVSGLVEQEAEEDSGQAGSLGLHTESNGETTEEAAGRKEAGAVERHVPAEVTDGELASVSAALDPHVTRKADKNGAGALEAEKNLLKMTEKREEKQGNGKGGYGVGQRGVIKPRAPRLGALGPTLAYLRSQTDQLG